MVRALLGRRLSDKIWWWHCCLSHFVLTCAQIRVSLPQIETVEEGLSQLSFLGRRGARGGGKIAQGVCFEGQVGESGGFLGSWCWPDGRCFGFRRSGDGDREWEKRGPKAEMVCFGRESLGLR